MKLCKDCRHSYGSTAAPSCTLPAQEGEEMSLATGRPTFLYADLRRKFGACGVEGRYFELKRPTPEFLTRYFKWLNKETV